MKLLKKSFLVSLIFFITLGLFACISWRADSPVASAASAEADYAKYLKITSATPLLGQNITKTSNGNYSIISNNTVSIIPNLFEYRFDLSETNFANFTVSTSDPITLAEDAGELEITYDGTTSTYYYTISQNQLFIYSSYLRPSSSLKVGNISNNFNFGISYNNLTRQMTYITAISYDFSLNVESLYLDIFAAGSSHIFNFEFVKPITKFASQEEPVLKFTCFGIGAGDAAGGYSPTWLPSERIYQTVSVKFFKNYTETNPLFFNINLNGFTYYYTIFTKDGNVVMQYSDEENSKENIYPIYQGSLYDINTFDIEFNQIGRYEIEVYDRTYDPNLTMAENKLVSANYYSTSFYIYDSTKTYENVYLVAESFKNGESDGYIVSSSSKSATLNNDIRATFKNLYFLNQEDFEKIKIVVTKTFFTGSIDSQDHIYTYETSEFMQECYDNKQDFYLDFEDDARYKINVYYDNNDSPFLTSSYEVVKQPKTLFQVGNEGDPYYDSYIETQPYKKTEKTYEVPLSSQISLDISYVNKDGILTLDSAANSTFKKTYLNKFTIFFGISQVNIEKYTRMIKEGGEETAASTLDIRINAVGRVEVTVTFGDEQTHYTFEENEDKVLSFSAYGDYHVYVMDEMGTISSASFSYQKSLNTSAILLIVLSLVLVLAIVLFILRSRAKVATR